MLDRDASPDLTTSVLHALSTPLMACRADLSPAIFSANSQMALQRGVINDIVFSKHQVHMV